MKRSVLTRYRVMAYVTAVMLLVLSTCMVFKYGFDTGEDATAAVSQAHGALYIIYLIVAFDLGQKARWPFGRLLWVLVSGTIPLVAFFMERRITAEIMPRVAEYERSERGEPALPAQAGTARAAGARAGDADGDPLAKAETGRGQ
jgi:integral membrane protein